jgi:aconitate hydratase
VDHLNNSLKFVNQSSRKVAIPLTCRIDTLDELEYFRYGGILQDALRQLAA